MLRPECDLCEAHGLIGWSSKGSIMSNKKSSINLDASWNELFQSSSLSNRARSLTIHARSLSLPSDSQPVVVPGSTNYQPPSPSWRPSLLGWRAFVVTTQNTIHQWQGRRVLKRYSILPSSVGPSILFNNAAVLSYAQLFRGGNKLHCAPFCLHHWRRGDLNFNFPAPPSSLSSRSRCTNM